MFADDAVTVSSSVKIVLHILMSLCPFSAVWQESDPSARLGRQIIKLKTASLLRACKHNSDSQGNHREGHTHTQFEGERNKMWLWLKTVLGWKHACYSQERIAVTVAVDAVIVWTDLHFFFIVLVWKTSWTFSFTVRHFLLSLINKNKLKMILDTNHCFVSPEWWAEGK